MPEHEVEDTALNRAMATKAAATADQRSARIQELVHSAGRMDFAANVEFTQMSCGGSDINVVRHVSEADVEEPTDEQIRDGWTRNPRGGWQPPDDQIDCSDAPATTNLTGWVRGPFREALKTFCERKVDEQSVQDLFRQRDASVPGSIEEDAAIKKILETIFSGSKG